MEKGLHLSRYLCPTYFTFENSVSERDSENGSTLFICPGSRHTPYTIVVDNIPEDLPAPNTEPGENGVEETQHVTDNFTVELCIQGRSHRPPTEERDTRTSCQFLVTPEGPGLLLPTPVLGQVLVGAQEGGGGPGVVAGPLVTYQVTENETVTDLRMGVVPETGTMESPLRTVGVKGIDCLRTTDKRLRHCRAHWERGVRVRPTDVVLIPVDRQMSFGFTLVEQVFKQ